MAIAGERAGVQNPLVRYAQEVGWEYLTPDEAFTQRGGEGELLLHETFLSQAQQLNLNIVDRNRAEDLARRITHVLPRIEGNLDAWEYLNGLKTVFVPEERRERNVRLLADNWQKNTYQVTDELSFFNGTYRIRLDVAFFINGIPNLLVEAKSATKIEGIADALDQVRRYHREGPELMALMQLYTLTHLVHYYYGPTWNTSHKSLFNWRSEMATLPDGTPEQRTDFETLVKTFIHPQRITRMITDFILFTHTDDVLSKVILRPHQMRAVEKVVQRSADSEKRRGLIWHTQGSGKTYTMITAAKQIIRHPAFENPTVLMLVDRNELEMQLFGNLAALEFGHVEVAQSKRHLIRILGSDYRGLIISMIHKFDDIPANINTRKNIIVMVDEAHRTTGGHLGNYLMAALPNATYIGFTGTPIDKTAYGKGTFVVFGKDDESGYLDKYSIAQSIEDGTTVPLHYKLAPNELRVDREVLDKEFLELVDAEGLSDMEQLDIILDRAVNLRNMLKNPDRMQRVASYVAQHYREVVEPMGYKAFLVGVDRETCARYKGILDKYLPPEYSQVVYSPAHNDQPELARYHISEEAEKAVRKAFRKPEQLPKILIVTEKLLTGFDAPILYCMYLDKPMRDHVLLQAIARVNRPYEDDSGRRKPAGFVLDFVGIFEKLEKALAFDTQDVEDVKKVVTEIELLKKTFAERMDCARVDYLPISKGFTGDKATEKVLAHFLDEDIRQTFYKFFRELADIYEIISPDAFLYDYLVDYDQLTRMYRLLRSAYDSIFVDRELTRKTATLVQTHTYGGAIQDTLDIYEINENLLEKLGEDDAPDTVKVFNLLKSIEQMVEKNLHKAPYLISIGERAQAIVRAFQERQQATQDALRALEELIQEINQAERERANMVLNPASFAVYWLLNKEGFPDAEKAAREMENVFDTYPHWQVSASQEREVRLRLYQVLLSAITKGKEKGQGTKETAEVTKMVEKLLNVAGRAGEN